MSRSREAFLCELDRLIQRFPDRWSRAALVAVVPLAGKIDIPQLLELLDNIEGALRGLQQ